MCTHLIPLACHVLYCTNLVGQTSSSIKSLRIKQFAEYKCFHNVSIQLRGSRKYSIHEVLCKVWFDVIT